MPARVLSSARTLRCSPAWPAWRIMSRATVSASTQYRTWTRIFCSVKWNIGENETTLGSFIWRKSPLDALLGAVLGDDLCGRGLLSGLVAEEDPLAEQFLFERGPGLVVGGEAEAQLGRVVTGEGGPHHPGHPARGHDAGDLGLHLLLGLAGLAPGEAGLDGGELTMGLCKGLVEAPGLLGMEPV